MPMTLIKLDIPDDDPQDYEDLDITCISLDLGDITYARRPDGELITLETVRVSFWVKPFILLAETIPMPMDLLERLASWAIMHGVVLKPVVELPAKDTSEEIQCKK